MIRYNNDENQINNNFRHLSKLIMEIIVNEWLIDLIVRYNRYSGRDSISYSTIDRNSADQLKTVLSVF